MTNLLIGLLLFKGVDAGCVGLLKDFLVRYHVLSFDAEDSVVTSGVKGVDLHV